MLFLALLGWEELSIFIPAYRMDQLLKRAQTVSLVGTIKSILGRMLAVLLCYIWSALFWYFLMPANITIISVIMKNIKLKCYAPFT